MLKLVETGVHEAFETSSARSGAALAGAARVIAEITTAMMSDARRRFGASRLSPRLVMMVFPGSMALGGLIGRIGGELERFPMISCQARG